MRCSKSSIFRVCSSKSRCSILSSRALTPVMSSFVAVLLHPSLIIRPNFSVVIFRYVFKHCRTLPGVHGRRQRLPRGYRRMGTSFLLT
jgi:hypothetical protein